jgi:hypothetical protein
MEFDKVETILVMKNSTAFFLLIIIILVIGNLYFASQFYSIRDKYEIILGTTRVNSKIIAFDKLFVDKVLKNTGEVSYEDRLKLENAVIETHDNEIIAAWHQFLNSKTEEQAQNGTKTLLTLFADKIIY